MNKMSKKTEYGLMALKIFLQDQDLAPVSAKNIAEIIRAPFEVVARVLQVLSSRGILKSEYGVNGGYQLAKKLTDVSIFEVIEALESSADLAKCLTVNGECEHESHCTITQPITHLNKKLQDFYKSMSVAEVLNV